MTPQELVNFKKACLRLFHDAQKLEKDLQRHEMFFFRDRDCDRWVVQGSIRVSLTPTPTLTLTLALTPALTPIRWVEDGSVDPLYEKACHWHQRAKGLLLVVHDAG